MTRCPTGGLTPDGRPAEGGISGSSVRLGDKVFKGLAAGSGALLLVVMAAIAIFLIWKAIPAFTDNSGNIFTTQSWNPQADPPFFGMAAVFFGTVMSSFIALVIGVPIAIGIALFISNYASRRAATTLGAMVDLLAAVPSLVFGMWGLYFLIPNTQGFQQWLSVYFGWIPIFGNETATTASQFGKSLLIAGIVLAIMIIPIVSAVCREVFLQVPRETIDAAWALGATKWEMIRTAVLPVRSGRDHLGRHAGARSRTGRDHRRRAGSQFRVRHQLAHHGAGRRHLRLDHRPQVRRIRRNPVAIAALIAAGLFLFVITLVVNSIARIVIARRKDFTA